MVRDTGWVSAPSQIPARTEVLVVGAGPGGSAAAAAAAGAGHEVTLLDAAVFPRDKTCGDGLTPRAIAELDALGLGDAFTGPRIEGLDLQGWGRRQQVRWPQASDHFPDYGSAVARTELDDRIRRHALDAGAAMVSGVKAVGATIIGGKVTAVQINTAEGPAQIEVEKLIVADGVKSALGTSLGRSWHRGTAYGVAARAYVESGRCDDRWMGSHLELRDGAGALLPGYGWVFPLGAESGLVNIGVGALATEKRPAHMALRPIIEHYTNSQRDDWQLTGPPVRIASALLPMGGAVSNVAGANWVLIGDAAACVNPLNGEGIDYALETARFAVEVLGEKDLSGLWPDLLRARYSLAFSAARRLAAVLTVPKVVPVLGRPGIRSAALMSMVVRVMGNLITEDDTDLIARAWRTAGIVSSKIDTRPPFS
ncbi:FAD-linked oxidoreductase [Williamsia sp. 1138]|nr:FAD-linked oxidoreductase [Williamsia sp. 1138]